MKAFFSINAGLITLAMFSASQENIPDAAPIADGPLVANPEQDTLDMADMLYKQAQAPATKENRQEYGRLLDLSLRKYLEFTQRFPQSAQAPLAEYRAAMCLEELGRKDEAHGLFLRLIQTGSPALVAASAYRLATDASSAGEIDKAIQYYQLVIRNAEQNDLKVDAQYRLGRLFLSSGNPEAAATMFCAVMGNPEADAKLFWCPGWDMPPCVRIRDAWEKLIPNIARCWKRPVWITGTGESPLFRPPCWPPN